MDKIEFNFQIVSTKVAKICCFLVKAFKLLIYLYFSVKMTNNKYLIGCQNLILYRLLFQKLQKKNDLKIATTKSCTIQFSL